MMAELAAKKQSLHDLLAGQKEIEAQVAGENGTDGRKKYPNEEARKSEVGRRLKADTRYRAIEKELNRVRLQLVELETNVERARYEFRAANTLLTLLASAIQANRPDVEQAVLAAGGQSWGGPGRARAPGCGPDRSQAENRRPEGSGGRHLQGAGSQGQREGRRRDLVRGGGTGTKVALCVKNGAARTLQAAVGKRVKARYRRLDRGLFAVEARPVA
ncbi:MAG: hypothetical protein ACUVTQ_12405 [Desulfotomaculales bacterium]